MISKSKIIKILSILCVVCLLCCGCSQQSQSTEETSSAEKSKIDWRKDVTTKYRDDDDVQQIVTVQVTEGTNAKITLLEKSKENKKRIWTKTLCCDGYIGKEGAGDADEEHCITPTGDYEITTAFGIKKNPGTKLPYIDVDDDIYCCGDEAYYNQIIDIKDCPHDCSNGEHMIDYSPEYNYGFFFDYNKEGTLGKGSAFFFHCTGLKTYTGGCIAVSEDNMVNILKRLDEHSRIIIDFMQ